MVTIEEKLSNINLIEVCLVIIVTILFISILPLFNINNVDEEWLYVIVICYLLFKFRGCGDSLRNDFQNIFSKIKFKNFLIVVVANIFFSYVMLYLFYFSIDFLDVTMSSFVILSKSIPLISSLISSIIIAPVFEELFFRGIILSKLKTYFSPIFAIILSSAIFAILHAPGSIISAFVFGICMAILYLKSNNIILPIVAHGFNNLCAEILYYFDPNELLFSENLLIIIFSIVGIVSAYLIFISIREELKRIV
ncbi:CPBP family intramembrane glutamic endopeptidase [Methanobrevibacter woesei]|uniref:CPBP family intramembrane glutamic endopeptidase n=1 Tax=Methanobrevibacter woesei TaxID=190976 RepID=UPI0023F55539|nr:type II CAAX endopeptidase family protein [Methanobrevibacter woesei]